MRKQRRAELKQEPIIFTIDPQVYLALERESPAAAVLAARNINGAERVRLAVCLSATKAAGAAGSEYNYWLRHWEERK